MEISKSNKAGVNRAHGRSIAQKWTFAIGHLAIIIICAWLIYGNGWEVLGHAFGKAWRLADFSRAQILLACAFIYWLRHIITLFYLLARKVEWSEVLGLLPEYGIPIIPTSLSIFKGNLNLITDIPELVGIAEEDLPPDITFIGPLLANLQIPLSKTIKQIPRDRPLIYFAMGSSGDKEIMLDAIRGFGDTPYNVIAAITNIVSDEDLRKMSVPPNVIVEKVVPAQSRPFARWLTTWNNRAEAGAANPASTRLG